jgi:intracellular sulfur oxidation DsrE/DsrF family protein
VSTEDRRNFLSRLTAFATLGVTAGGRQATAQRPEPQTGSLEPWLTGLTGQHRQFFDVGSLDSAALRRVKNFLDGYVQAYRLTDRDIVAVFGAHGKGLGFVLGDAVWSRFELGKLYGLTDPDSTPPAPAVRNVFRQRRSTNSLVEEAYTLTRLAQRGVRFFACNNTMNSLADQVSARMSLDRNSVYEEVKAGLLPGVFVVPAMTVAGNRAQEIGLTYSHIS